MSNIFKSKATLYSKNIKVEHYYQHEYIVLKSGFVLETIKEFL